MKEETRIKIKNLIYDDINQTYSAMACFHNNKRRYDYQREKLLETVNEVKIILEADIVLDALSGTFDTGFILFNDATPIENYLKNNHNLFEALSIADDGRMRLWGDDLNPENLFKVDDDDEDLSF
ncbi:hypothetical protein ACFL6P_05005 [Candidatus Latescibacterota bacterium]